MFIICVVEESEVRGDVLLILSRLNLLSTGPVSTILVEPECVQSAPIPPQSHSTHRGVSSRRSYKCGTGSLRRLRRRGGVCVGRVSSSLLDPS